MTDGYVPYRARLLRLRCWAHLKRKLSGVAESTDRRGAQAGTACLSCSNNCTRIAYSTATPRSRRYAKWCASFSMDWDVIVRPLADPRLPVTNNAAERQLRHHVIAPSYRLWPASGLAQHGVSGQRHRRLPSAACQRDRLACPRDPCRPHGPACTSFPVNGKPGRRACGGVMSRSLNKLSRRKCRKNLQPKLDRPIDRSSDSDN